MKAVSCTLCAGSGGAPQFWGDPTSDILCALRRIRDQTMGPDQEMNEIVSAGPFFALRSGSAFVSICWNLRAAVFSGRWWS